MKRALETFYYKELAFIVVAAFFALFTSHLSMPTFFVDLLLIWFVLKTGQLIGQDTERNHEFQNAVKELGEYHKLTSTKKDKAKGGVVLASDKFPRFFDVDGVLVVLFKEGDDVFGKTASGNSYPIGKALSEGEELTEEEFTRRKAAESASA